MRDGPRSTGQAGHWLRFAQDVSRRDRYDLDRDVKLFFSVANVAFDASIAAWDSKRYYDSTRLYWYVRHFYRGLKLEGYAGPGSPGRCCDDAGRTETPDLHGRGRDGKDLPRPGRLPHPGRQRGLALGR